MKTQTAVIPFNGTNLLTKKENSTIWVALKPIVTAMGLDWKTQIQKVKNDERFNCRHMPMVGADGKSREMLSLDASQLPAFLYSINPNKVHKDLRDRIIAFQDETFKVINEYWNNNKTYNNKNIEHIISGYKSQIAQKNKYIQELQAKLKLLENTKQKQDTKQPALPYKPFGRSTLVELVGAIQREQQDLDNIICTLVGHYKVVGERLNGLLKVYPDINPTHKVAEEWENSSN